MACRLKILIFFSWLKTENIPLNILRLECTTFSFYCLWWRWSNLGARLQEINICYLATGRSVLGFLSLTLWSWNHLSIFHSFVLSCFFLWYINDLPNASKLTQPLLFAYDIIVFSFRSQLLRMRTKCWNTQYWRLDKMPYMCSPSILKNLSKEISILSSNRDTKLIKTLSFYVGNQPLKQVHYLVSILTQLIQYTVLDFAYLPTLNQLCTIT